MITAFTHVPGRPPWPLSRVFLHLFYQYDKIKHEFRHHNYPHLSKSGPAFGFLAEVLDFWKEHVFVPGNTTFDRNTVRSDTNRRDVPGVRVHVQRPPLDGGPTTAPERAEGYWVAEHSQDHLDAAATEGAFLLSFTPTGALEADVPGANPTSSLDIFANAKVMKDTP